MGHPDPAPLTAQDVADYFLSRVDEIHGDNLSNLKLQKLLYYAQGFHLAMVGSPLFDDAIMAWNYGPVVPDIYHRYKPHGAGAIPRPEDFDAARFPAEVVAVLDEVNDVYGQFSAVRLMQLTHEEPPWRTTAINHVIDPAKMRDYFVTQVADGQS